MYLRGDKSGDEKYLNKINLIIQTYAVRMFLPNLLGEKNATDWWIIISQNKHIVGNYQIVTTRYNATSRINFIIKIRSAD